MRLLGIDFGTKTTGVAVSDPLGFTAQGLEIIRRTDTYNLKPTINRIQELCIEYKVEKIVLGYPKNMNNTEGERCEHTVVFKKKLEASLNLPIELWDERLTTVEAENLMIIADMSRQKRKKVIDKMAAGLILQNYLDAHY
ncbi:MAG: Holliday junction resolvase RuvX [Niameybacter sp.]|uniref:Holliday junction resolvase RuvX n=2 Tax=Niameybacter sp. TaxID=2033640 RepID=UPI002FC93899